MFVAPNKKNDATTYTHQWAVKAIKIAKGLGYKVVELHGKDTTYDKVSNYIEKYQPRLLAFFSHGCPTALNGQTECVVNRKYSISELLEMGEKDPERLDKILNPVKLSGCGRDICMLNNEEVCKPLCLRDTNVALLKDRIIVAIACHSSSQLGRCAISYGASSYSGYSDLLLFPVDGMRSQDMFGEIQTEHLRYILEGYSVGEANAMARSMEDTYIKLYKKTKWISLPLLWNMLHHEVLGDKNARIF